MKNGYPIFICILLSLFASGMPGCRKSNTNPSTSNAKSICNAGAVTISAETFITGSCLITGDLTILNNGKLNVDLTGVQDQTFVVRGNISLTGNALLWVHEAPGSTGGQFIVSSSYKGQRTISAKDSSRVQLENIEFRAQEGNLSAANSFDVNYNGFDHSVLNIYKSWLDTKASWILCNLHNHSSLIGYDGGEVPTEIYLEDSAQVKLQGLNTKAGIWMNFESTAAVLISARRPGPALYLENWQGLRGTEYAMVP